MDLHFSFGIKTTAMAIKIKMSEAISMMETVSPRTNAPPVTPNTGTSMIDNPLLTGDSFRAT